MQTLDTTAIKTLAQETAIPQRSLSLLVAGARLSAEAGVSEPIIYGLVRTGSPTSLKQIFTATDSRIRRQLKNAQDSGIIPIQDQAGLDAAVRTVQNSEDPLGTIGLG